MKEVYFSLCVILCCPGVVQKLSAEFVVGEISHGRIARQIPDGQHHPLPSENATDVDVGSDILAETAEWLESTVKSFLKDMVRSLMAVLISSGERPIISSSCTKGLMKYAHELTKARVWALKMLDSTSKPPAGLLEGTFADLGAFDQCLEITVPHRNGSENFRGTYCSLEVSPLLPPRPKNLSSLVMYREKAEDTLTEWYLKSSSTFYHVRSRLGLCLPSTCTADDVAKLFPSVITSRFNVVVKKCYVEEGIKWLPIHFIVMFILAVLAACVLVGTFMENYMPNYSSENVNSGGWKILTAFSLTSNWQKLVSTKQTNGELRVLHGIRFLSLAWVLLGHTYVWANVNIARRPKNAILWFESFDFGTITNGWLSVDTFFLLSGLLTCYTGYFAMEKTNGRINIPLFMIYRYLRLTPSLMLSMGLIFFLPLISSGPLYDQYVDPHIESCRHSWWKNIIYISNWLPMAEVCIYPMWYLSADFQLFILALLILMLMYRSTFYGILTVGLLVLGCNVLLGVLTYVRDLPPTVLFSAANEEQIRKTLDFIHFKTYTHVGPYFAGLLLGYILHKKKDIKLQKWQNAVGWCLSIIISIYSVYGLYQWNTSYVHSTFASSLYAALHRTTFALGVAWVIYACVTGSGGPINWILSSTVWVPLSRLTFMCYLLHALVLWTKMGTTRERRFASHYIAISSYFASFVFLIPLSTLFFLLVEAPFSKLLHMLFSKAIASRMKDKTEPQKELPAPTDAHPNHGTIATVVELRAVKTHISN